MANFVNKWIRGEGSPQGKDKRRKIVAFVAIVAGVICAIAIPQPIGIGVGIVLGGLAAIKLKNAVTDDT